MIISTEIQKKILEYVLATPAALAVLAASFISGHLWLFIFKAFRKRTAGGKVMESITGRFAMGISWLTMSLIPTYWIKYNNLSFEYVNILTIFIPVIIFSIATQLIIFVAYLVLGDK